MKCFTSSKATAAIEVVTNQEYKAWYKRQKQSTQRWLKLNDAPCVMLPNAKGELDKVVLRVEDADDMWLFAGAFNVLPNGKYHFDHLTLEQYQQAAIAWALADYQFDCYQAKKAHKKQLALPKDLDKGLIQAMVESLYLMRDMINTPACDMGPAQMEKMATMIAEKHDATIQVIKGKQLLAKNFPAVFAVGQAADRAPCLVDMQWGPEDAPRLTLVGKGVCYDTGGLSLKPTSNMVLMKKDMGGAALALALAQLIMSQKLYVRLQVIFPAVENAVSGNAYRPGDVITMRNGLTVEVGNTDAEGRLVLADALSYACEQKPDLLLDFATLTGATKVALGADMVGMYSDEHAIMQGLYDCSIALQDPVWPLPLHADYETHLKSEVADLSNIGNAVGGGGIIAGLFLKQFVESDIPWAHFDFGAWNTTNRPGRPKGGEAQGLRALFSFIADWADC
jgi:leucyl aminopeptidase